MFRSQTARLLASAVLAAGLAVAATEPAAAQYKFCALRNGPNGPCTCRGPNDAPGQWSTVSRSRCGVVPPAAAAPGQAPADAAAAPAAPTTEAKDLPASGATAGAPVAGKDAAPPPATDTAKDQTSAPVQEAAPQAAPGTAAKPPPEQTGAIPVPVPPALATANGQTLTEVRARGNIVCGINGDLVGFSSRGENGDWRGLDVDFCRAIAAATLGDASKVEFVEVPIADRFDVLRSGKIDLLARNTTWNMQREAELGLEFPGVLYYDGQSITAKQDAGLVSAQQLGGSKICVLAATTTEKNLRYYYSMIGMTTDIVTLPDQPALIKAYEDGTCAAYSGDRSALFSDRLRFQDPTAHAVLPEVISKEPLGPVVRDGDAHWVKIVRWTLAALINAEEIGLSQQSLKSETALSEDGERLLKGAGDSGKALGLDPDWVKSVILNVGNYGEIYERDLGGQSQLGMERGLNALWKRGGILYAPPMW